MKIFQKLADSRARAEKTQGEPGAKLDAKSKREHKKQNNVKNMQQSPRNKQNNVKNMQQSSPRKSANQPRLR